MSKTESAAKVLVVDDELSLRHIVSKALQNDGYIISTAADGREALGMIKHKEFDLMFLDIRMPKVTGEDVLAVVKNINPSLPVVILSAVNDPITKDEMNQLGAAAYLEKPCNLDEIVEIANRLIKCT